MSRPRIAIATCADHPELKGDDEVLCEALRRSGCEAASMIWDEDGIDWAGFDLCLVRSTWDYHEKYDRFLEWARRVGAVTRLRNPADLIAWNSDKRYLRALAEAGVPTVPTLWVERGSGLDLEGELAARGWREAVVKPVVDLGARNLRRVGAGEGAREALDRVLARQEAMVQPFLPSLEEQGELSLIYVAGRFSHAVRKRPAAGDFRVQSIWGGTISPAEPKTAQVELAELALAQLEEAPLYARIDIVGDRDGDPCLIELELIEPNLYLSTDSGAVERLADAVMAQLP